jgi:malic enzyme
MSFQEESLKLHGEWKGKIEVISTVPVKSKRDLALAYTPGVAEPCLAIRKDINLSYDYTRRWNLVAVVTDGTAVLGLGDIGPEAVMPVMEGKCVLFKPFGDVDAFSGIFRGTLDVRASDINDEMKIAAARAIASLISSEGLREECVLLLPFDPRIGRTVAAAVAKAARKQGVARI